MNNAQASTAHISKSYTLKQLEKHYNNIVVIKVEWLKDLVIEFLDQEGKKTFKKNQVYAKKK